MEKTLRVPSYIHELLILTLKQSDPHPKPILDI